VMLILLITFISFNLDYHNTRRTLDTCAAPM
jgi:hypothetical protein